MNIQSYVDSYKRSEEFKTLLFYRGPFSQWWYSPFIDINGIEFNCTEQFMMYHKALLFNDHNIASKIMEPIQKYTDQKSFTYYPRLYQKLGRQVSNFSNDVWEDNRIKIVALGTLYKFSSCNELHDALVSTDDFTLVEASPVDKIWGIGLDDSNPNAFNPSKWRGLNLLGQSLTKVRDSIK